MQHGSGRRTGDCAVSGPSNQEASCNVNQVLTSLAEPIAIIGMSCRFTAGLDSLDSLWTFLADGRSAVGSMPDKRWEPYGASSPQATSVLRSTTRSGSFMADIEGFDADFFGISPREAEYLDPQQRIVLELAWEALEHAGIPPLGLRGSTAGVFVSANSNDYGRWLLEDIVHSGAYAVNGATFYGIANRISYFLDLRGPSMAVDTACAGSLTGRALPGAAPARGPRWPVRPLRGQLRARVGHRGRSLVTRGPDRLLQRPERPEGEQRRA
jgi:6-methylsalicylic acid synthase